MLVMAMDKIAFLSLRFNPFPILPPGKPQGCGKKMREENRVFDLKSKA
jgi:hypothetical protein